MPHLPHGPGPVPFHLAISLTALLGSFHTESLLISSGIIRFQNAPLEKIMALLSNPGLQRRIPALYFASIPSWYAYGVVELSLVWWTVGFSSTYNKSGVWAHFRTPQLTPNMALKRAIFQFRDILLGQCFSACQVLFARITAKYSAVTLLLAPEACSQSFPSPRSQRRPQQLAPLSTFTMRSPSVSPTCQ